MMSSKVKYLSGSKMVPHLELRIGTTREVVNIKMKCNVFTGNNWTQIQEMHGHADISFN